MRGRRDLRRALALVVALAAGVAAAQVPAVDPTAPPFGGAAGRAQVPAVDDLGADDPRAVEAAIAQIEQAHSDADTLFAAARACEDRLHDPVHAAALYERIVRTLPDARVAIPAARRAEQLRAQLGSANEFATAARELSRLVAEADRIAPETVIMRGDALAHVLSWPGAPDAELWLAEWLRGRGRYAAAQARYDEIARHWPGSPQALEAARDAAGCALDARDWTLARELAERLPGGNPVEDAARSELIAAARRGHRRELLATGGELALALACLVLLASLADGVRRGGTRWPSPRPPLEVMFLTPIAAVIVAIAWFAQRTIAPAVTWISIAGIALAWLSGATLDLMRARGRATRARSLVHVAACTLGVLAVAYLVIVSGGLIDLLVDAGRP